DVALDLLRQVGPRRDQAVVDEHHQAVPARGLQSRYRVAQRGVAHVEQPLGEHHRELVGHRETLPHRLQRDVGTGQSRAHGAIPVSFVRRACRRHVIVSEAGRMENGHATGLCSVRRADQAEASFTMRYLNIVLGILMLAFVAVQYNDPDGPIWMAIYAVPAIWAFLAAFRLPVLQSAIRSEEHTSELQSRENLVCRLLLEKKKKQMKHTS